MRHKGRKGSFRVSPHPLKQTKPWVLAVFGRWFQKVQVREGTYEPEKDDEPIKGELGIRLLLGGNWDSVPLGPSEELCGTYLTIR